MLHQNNIHVRTTPTFCALPLGSFLADTRHRECDVVGDGTLSVGPTVQSTVALAQVVVVAAAILRLDLGAHGTTVAYSASDATLTAETTRSPRRTVYLLARRTLQLQRCPDGLGILGQRRHSEYENTRKKSRQHRPFHRRDYRLWIRPRVEQRRLRAGFINASIAEPG